jgi:tetratricopeptide (TPR) repeat protein
MTGPDSKRPRNPERSKIETGSKKRASKALERSSCPTPRTSDIERLLRSFSSGNFAQSRELADAFNQNYPHHFLGWLIQGCIIAQTSNPSDALPLLQRSATYAPENPDVHFNLAIALLGANQADQAVKSLRETVRLKSDHIPARTSLGNALKACGKLDEAISAYREAIQLATGVPELHFNLGLALREQGALEEAHAAFLTAIHLRPGIGIAHYNLGHTLRDLNRPKEAESAYREAIRLSPNNPDLYLSLGNLLREEKRDQEAALTFKDAIRVDPKNAKAHSNFGNALKTLRELEKAEEHHREAVRLSPDEGETYINLGNTLKEMGRLSEAVDIYQAAILRLPLNSAAHMNLGNTLYELGLPEAAEAAYSNAIKITPDFAEAHWNRGLAHLLHGAFTSGWPLYEWRFKHEVLRIQRKISVQPEWNGEDPIFGKTLLLYAEQGLGDTLQFARFARVLSGQGIKVILEVQPQLKTVLSTLECNEIIAQGDSPPSYDFHFPLMSLPLALGITDQNIPYPERYLTPDPLTTLKWQDRLGAKCRPRIGLVVSGNPRHSQDHHRSIPLASLAGHFPSGFDVVLLQIETRPEDQKTARTLSSSAPISVDIEDFEDTAALCSLMDLVISVDTSVAHLSGALGVPTWVLLPYIPDWRWLLGRRDSPWYQSLRLYRQAEDRSWVPVIATVMADLERHFGLR